MLCNSFHADLHAGNLMLLDDGRVGFIDFGIVGQLKPEVWTACIAFMDALQKTDYILMAENMLKMGMTAVKIDTQVLAADLVTQLRYQLNGYHIVKGFTKKNIINNNAVVNNCFAKNMLKIVDFGGYNDFYARKWVATTADTEPLIYQLESVGRDTGGLWA